MSHNPPGEPVKAASRRRRPRMYLALGAGAVAVAFTIGVASPSMAAVEDWASTTSTLMHSTGGSSGSINSVAIAGASDGRALQMQLNANPAANPGNGPEIATNQSFQFGVFGSRLRMADCTGQNRPGVVTGTFTFSTDHSDSNGNGLADNSEIDIEVLCAQPNVIWLTLWTDISGSDVRKISRAVDMTTGQIPFNCFNLVLGGACQPLLAGENSPASVTPIPGFNSGTQFHTYMFDWQRDHVTFWMEDTPGVRNILWDYRGPASRIPQKPSLFMQNVWFTTNWDPLDGPAHNKPTVATSAFIDSTVIQGGSAGGPPATNPPPTNPPSPNPPPTNSPPASGLWAPFTPYAVGQVVTFNGASYRCRQAHTSLPGWEPPNVLALWLHRERPAATPVARTGHRLRRHHSPRHPQT